MGCGLHTAKAAKEGTKDHWRVFGGYEWEKIIRCAPEFVHEKTYRNWNWWNESMQNIRVDLGFVYWCKSEEEKESDEGQGNNQVEIRRRDCRGWTKGSWTVAEVED